ncbi:lysozyme inhibitor LprI family protein [Trinickia dinghuensis]|uniref:DUF1311 domain-containing protein n=1 Tax=Trinickia dinghuensis TaxID=2291023 RepID=A0A3D8JSR4_9BURK|nr:lysozyme inhibitor LprI family protein [Trinickia dinghuensis]RDU96078.1 DUF1311 domain-containing protein [Trinickia dinghuensis]
MSAERPTKRILLLLAFLSVWAVAARAQTLTAELAEHSGMSPIQVTTLLANCDANQTSMKFCALRDELAAERTLRHLIDERRAASPKCGAVLAQKVAAWRKQRDETCQKSAEQQWGDGSMLSAAVAMCATDRTKQMMQTLSSNSCP